MAKLNWKPPTVTEYAEYSWNVDYAAEVHELQGNRWTDRGLNGSNLAAYLAANYSGSLDEAFKATVEYLGERMQNEAPKKTGKLKASFKIEYKNL